MKMWFTEGCFFRNFPRWRLCSAMLALCQGCPLLWAASQAGAVRAGVAARGRSRGSSLIGEDVTATHQPQHWHRTAGSLCRVSTLLSDPGMRERGKMRCSTQERGRAEGEILDLEKSHFLLPVSHGRVTFPGRSRGHDNSLFPMQYESGVLITCGLIPEHLPQNQDVFLARLQPGLSSQHPFVEARDQKSS